MYVGLAEKVDPMVHDTKIYDNGKIQKSKWLTFLGSFFQNNFQTFVTKR